MTDSKTKLDTIERAVADISAGKPVIVVDHASRENEGDFIMAAEDVTPELVAFLLRYSTGIICAPMTGELCDKLELPAMYRDNQDRKHTAFTVSVDARENISTGVSASDRAATLRALADPEAQASTLSRPGHVFPLRAHDGGVLVRRGHTEAAIDFMRLAGKQPVAAIVEIMNDDGTMMRMPQLLAFAKKHGLALVSIADLAAYRQKHETQIERVASAKLPTEFGNFQVSVWRDKITAREHVALISGDLSGNLPVLTRVHSECMTGDIFRSKRCDCGEQLSQSMSLISSSGRGVLVYMGGHEGRGIGLANKIRAYALQDAGEDTVEANLKLGLPVDSREYHVAGQILNELGVKQIRLLTNNPDKLKAMSRSVEVVEQVPIETIPNEYNISYLRTKQQRLHHSLHLDDPIFNKEKVS
jgi:3,4-dihydroxy 2-butanone 4-phosphate synthase / GTP cyclohydrolase II